MFLGGLCLIIAIVGMGVVNRAQPNQVDPNASTTLAVVAVAGVIWLGTGLMACFQQVPAVYVALVLGDLSLVGQFLNFGNLNWLRLLIPIVIIAQSHQVIHLAGRLTRRRIMLTARPRR